MFARSRCPVQNNLNNNSGSSLVTVVLYVQERNQFSLFPLYFVALAFADNFTQSVASEAIAIGLAIKCRKIQYIGLKQ